MRSLTYVPELPVDRDPGRVADELGGALLQNNGGACVAIDHLWDADHWHGRRRLSSYRLDPSAPLALFDGRAGALPDWAQRVVFFDVETTGLSGGAGTLAFLVGCGWFEADAFHVRQFFLCGPSGERTMLQALANMFDVATLLVTFNGRTFDVPLMETRWAFHRTSAPTEDLPHFDMLPTARRLWGRTRDRRAARGLGRGQADWEISPPYERENCSLSALEQTVLGFHRLADVAGFEIPSRYFQFLRAGDPRVITGILEHNRHDLLSLAAVMSHALWLAHEGPEACREAGEQVGLGRLYERAGHTDRATRAYELAATTGERDVRSHALARLAGLLRREQRYDESAAAWQSVLELTGQDDEPMTPLTRRAAEALAVHHEHRVRDLTVAKRYAEALRTNATGRFRQDVEHRLTRLDRKLKRSENREEAGLKWESEDG